MGWAGACFPLSVALVFNRHQIPFLLRQSISHENDLRPIMQFVTLRDSISIMTQVNLKANIIKHSNSSPTRRSAFQNSIIHSS